MMTVRPPPWPTCACLAALVLTSACHARPERAAAPRPAARSASAIARAASPADTARAAPQAPTVVPANEAPSPVQAAATAQAATAGAPDLAAEADRATAAARRDLGAGATARVVAERWVLLGAPGWGGAAFAASVDLTEGALAALFNGRFRRPPAHVTTVYLFPSADPYDRWCRAHRGQACFSKYGFYEPSERRLVLNAGLGLGTLTHELVHPIVEADFPGAPSWIDEGIASLFEAPVLPRPGEIHGVRNWRLPRLQAALASPGEAGAARLERLFGMSNETFRGPGEDLHYAMARYLCQWLDERGQLWPFYRRWRDAAAADPANASAEGAFVAVVGRSPAEARPDWERWTRSR